MFYQILIETTEKVGKSKQNKTINEIDKTNKEEIISDILVPYLKEEEFDYIIIDCPAGIEQGFKNAIAGADRAIVITTPEVSAVRDADRIIGLLEASGLNDPTLVLNRLRVDMVKRGDMMSIDDVTEILAIEILGVVPDDESIVVATNKGEPAVTDEESFAGQAYRNIVKRIQGEDVPIMRFEKDAGLFNKLFKKFRRN